MSIILKNITLRNFLSIGNVTQAVNLDKKDLTLILGENLDLGGDGARNGTGKTTLIQGLSYALFGIPINNIRKDNLVNRTNTKGMLVTLEFSVNGIEYKIERGRKPNVLRFYVNNQQQKVVDDAQGENKETQQEIERIICMSSDMFKHIVALNTYSEPFLAMKPNDQRNIIEQLLGITLLSEKAELIKSQMKFYKDSIQEEEYKIKGIEEANKRVGTQIDSMKRRHQLWVAKHEVDLKYLVDQYDELSKIDIEKELLSHNQLTIYNQKKTAYDIYNAVVARHTAWEQKRDKEVVELQETYDKLSHIDIDIELQAHKNKAERLVQLAAKQSKIKELSRLTKDIDAQEKLISKLVSEIETLKEHKCHTCGQDFHDEQHTSVLAGKTDMLVEAQDILNSKTSEYNTINSTEIQVIEPEPVTFYKTETEAITHSNKIANILESVVTKQNEESPFAEQLTEVITAPGARPTTIYDTEAQAIKHSSQVINLLEQITGKHADVSPYLEQIADMESEGLQEISFDGINRLTRTMEHQKFLLDILTSKDSFVRKKIVDQNLSYLNGRLTHYLDRIGLPHQVIFKNDMSVEITELGRELDFGNLSRGEANRLILGLSFAFRDVWENLYQPINSLFIDELIDSGLDTMGVENSVAILKEMSRRRNKSIWLVSHREELSGRVPNILKVIKENGFTTYSTAVDVQ
jgi:DNA repair exonuclease SbcCD ATPase subunit